MGDAATPELDAAIEQSVAEAAAHLREQRWEEAERCYRDSLRRMGEETGPRRAEVLVCLAEIAIAREAADEALVLLEQALHAFPKHEGAVRRALDLTVRAGRHTESMVFRRRLLALGIDEDEQTAQYRALVHDAAALAVESLEALRGRSVTGFDTLERLRAAHETAGNAIHAADVMVAQAEAVAEPRERARAMVRAAEFCAERTGKTARAVALYEAAIADDPAVQGAFEAIERVLVQREDWPELEKAYRRQAQRLEEANEKAALAALLGRLAELRHDRLADRKGAIDALSRRIQLEPSNVDARAALAVLLEMDGNSRRACRVLETSAWHAATREDTYHALVRLYSQDKRFDRAFQA
ncbi:MAG: hypothetical protein ACOC1F_13440, partial [Myxococcota bacterium]